MDTKLWGRNTPGGLFSIVDRTGFPTGNVWWVGSTVATCENAVGHGRSPDAPFATWVYAVPASAAGDTIYHLPGNAEPIGITPAEANTLSIAGCRHIGLGGRTLKPAILVDGFIDTYVSVTGAGTVIENIAFSAGHSDIAAGMIIAADGVELRKCDFLQNTTNENFLICVSDAGANTADGLIIEDHESGSEASLAIRSESGDEDLYSCSGENQVCCRFADFEGSSGFFFVFFIRSKF